MSVRKNRATSLTSATPRQWTARVSIGILTCSSVLLMVMSQINSQTTNHMRATIMDISLPVIAFAAKPLDVVADFSTWVGEIANLRAENIALKNSNVQLLKWQSVAKNLEAENNSLRSLMNVVAIPKSNYITARIVTDIGGPYVRSALIGGGIGQGIKKDQAVINEYGLVGRIVEAGENSSRVLLLNDINSRVPVMLEATRQKAILVGNNDELPSLSYVANDSVINVGDRVVTSGDGGVFPSGIVVGVVNDVAGGVVHVQPFVDATAIEYVTVVDYSL